jgi:hypothetical protein
VLEEFSEISALKCNFDKSSIVFVGGTPTEIKTRFVVKDEFTLLGIKIDAKLERLHENFSTARQKINKTINFWDRFNLSLPGRILISKTFLLSQLNYFGSILLPDEILINELQNTIV